MDYLSMTIGKQKNIALIAHDPKKRLHIRIVRLGRERIGKENHKINLSFHNLGSDLLVAA